MGCSAQGGRHDENPIRVREPRSGRGKWAGRVRGSRSKLRGPRSWLGGPRSKLGGPRSWVGEPRSWLGGPRSWVGGPRSGLGGPRSWLGGPRSWVGGPRSWLDGPRSWLGGPRSTPRGWRSDLGAWVERGRRSARLPGRRPRWGLAPPRGAARSRFAARCLAPTGKRRRRERRRSARRDSPGPLASQDGVRCYADTAPGSRMAGRGLDRPVLAHP